jgi:zinc protease
MKLAINPTEYFSLATVTTEKSDIVKAIITIDTHTQNSLNTQVVEYLYSDMVLSGSGTYTREAFIEAVNLLGASIDVDVTAGKVSFVLRSTATQFNKLLKLFKTMLQDPTFSAAELKRVKGTSLNQLHQAKEDSKNIALDELRNGFYGAADRKYTYSVKDSMMEVPKIKVTQLKKFHQSVMTHPWFCSIAGDKTTTSVFEKTVKSIKQEATLVEGVHQPMPAEPRLHIENIPSRQNIDLSIGLPLPITRSHPDFIPLGFAMAILAKWGGFAGRLMSTVRAKEGLTYCIYGRLEGFASDEQGYLRIMTFFAPDKTIQGLGSTFKEINKLYTSGVSQEEIDTFKTILSTQQSLIKDSFGGILADLHAYHCEGFTITEMEEHKRSLLDVTKVDGNNAIKTYLDPTLMSVSAAGPTKALESELKKWMTRLAY